MVNWTIHLGTVFLSCQSDAVLPPPSSPMLLKISLSQNCKSQVLRFPEFSWNVVSFGCFLHFSINLLAGRMIIPIFIRLITFLSFSITMHKTMDTFLLKRSSSIGFQTLSISRPRTISAYKGNCLQFVDQYYIPF